MVSEALRTLLYPLQDFARAVEKGTAVDNWKILILGIIMKTLLCSPDLSNCAIANLQLLLLTATTSALSTQCTDRRPNVTGFEIASSSVR
jgi:hypothetical protein